MGIGVGIGVGLDDIKARPGAAPPAETIVCTLLDTTVSVGGYLTETDDILSSATNDLILVIITAKYEYVTQIDSVVFGVADLSLVAVGTVRSGASVGYCYVYAGIVPAGTGQRAAVTWSTEEGNESPQYATMIVAKATGIATTGFTDRTKVARASGTAPDSGLTTVTSLDHELILAVVTWPVAPAVAGSWLSGYTDVATYGSGLAPWLNLAYRVITTAEQGRAYKTNVSTGEWGALCVTFKAA